MKTIIPVIAFLLNATVSHAENTEMLVTSSVDKSVITIGDRIRYRIDIAYPKGTEIETPAIGVHLGDFEVKDYKIGEPKKLKDGRIHSTYEYVISTFTTGDYAIPPVPIGYKTPEGAANAIFSDKIDIKVNSVKSSESGDVKDIKSPLEIRGGLDWWWWVLIGVIAIGAAGFWGVWYYRKRSVQKDEAMQKPPYEMAIEALELLMSRELLEKRQIREFVFAISEIVRKYLGGRYHFNAIDLTTFELLGAVDGLNVSPDIKNIIGRFCLASDLVKFADQTASVEECREMMALVKRIIMETRPVSLPDQASGNSGNSQVASSLEGTIESKVEKAA